MGGVYSMEWLVDNDTVARAKWRKKKEARKMNCRSSFRTIQFRVELNRSFRRVQIIRNSGNGFLFWKFVKFANDNIWIRKWFISSPFHILRKVWSQISGKYTIWLKFINAGNMSFVDMKLAFVSNANCSVKNAWKREIDMNRGSRMLWLEMSHSFRFAVVNNLVFDITINLLFACNWNVAECIINQWNVSDSWIPACIFQQ